LTDPDLFHLLATAHIVRPAHLMRPDRHLGLELGDQTGILDPAVTQPLAAAVRKRLPGGVAGIAVANGVVEILLGYLDQTGLSYTRPEGAYFVMVDISPFGYASDVEFAHWMTNALW